MEIAGFESAQYFAFVVSDLSQHEIVELARGLAPALSEKLHTIALLLTPNANNWLAKSVSLHILRETNQCNENAVVKFRSDNKMAEESFSSRSNLRSIIFVLLAFPRCHASRDGMFRIGGSGGTRTRGLPKLTKNDFPLLPQACSLLHCLARPST
jgi:hypothetical protein